MPSIDSYKGVDSGDATYAETSEPQGETGTEKEQAKEKAGPLALDPTLYTLDPAPYTLELRSQTPIRGTSRANATHSQITERSGFLPGGGVYLGSPRLQLTTAQFMTDSQNADMCDTHMRQDAVVYHETPARKTGKATWWQEAPRRPMPVRPVLAAALCGRGGGKGAGGRRAAAGGAGAGESLFFSRLLAH